MKYSLLAIAALLVSATVLFALSCGGDGEDGIGRTHTATPVSTSEPAGDASNGDAIRLASHLFLPVGESRSTADLGELIEIIHVTEPPAVSADNATLTATAGGISCLRFKYREVVNENDVQTLCVVSFDNTGDCSGLNRVSLDLQQFLDAGGETEGNANFLEAGEGLFYAVCRTAGGEYRLQQPADQLPPLY